MKSLPLAKRKHVELIQNTLNKWTDFTTLVQNNGKTKQTIALYVRSDADRNKPGKEKDQGQGAKAKVNPNVIPCGKLVETDGRTWKNQAIGR